jgi:hypothetical protein
LNERICIECKSSTTSIGKRISKRTGKLIIWEQWCKHPNGYRCKRCHNREYSKLVSNPKRDPEKMRQYTRQYNIKHPEKLKENNKKRVAFKGKAIYVKENNRKGLCIICKKKIGDTYINRSGQEKIIQLTHTHHKEYHKDDVLKDTIEICNQCHAIETWKIWKESTIIVQRKCLGCKKEFSVNPLVSRKKKYCNRKCTKSYPKSL